METSLIQARVDAELKNDATVLFDSLGLDMTTAIRIYLRKCLQVGGIPFDIKLNETDYLNANKAYRMLRQQSQDNGVSGMSLDEINMEIDAVRKAK